MKKIILGIVIIILGVIIIKNYINTPNNVSTTEISEQESNKLITLESTTKLETGNYNVIGSESIINWEGKVGDIKSHVGTFAITSGAITIADSTNGNITIDIAHLESDSAGLDAHLKNEDFFDVETYPTSTFIINEITATTLTGELTIKETTNSVTVPITIMSADDGIYTIKGSFDFDRTQWGIQYKSSSFFSDLGDKAIDDIVPIDLVLVLEKN